MSVTYARLFDRVDDARVVYKIPHRRAPLGRVRRASKGILHTNARAFCPLFKESGPAEKLRALDTRASSAQLVLRDMCGVRGRAAGSRSRSIRSLRVVRCTPFVRKLLTVHQRAGSVRP